LTSYSQTRYVSPSDTTPTIGDIVYQNSDLQTVFNGNNQWFKTTWGAPTEYSIQIATNGQVSTVTSCSTCPSQTPTPTISTTPAVTPTITSTPTETPTETPTPTPTPTSDPFFYYETIRYSCGLSGDGCNGSSTGTPVLRFTNPPSSAWYSNGIDAYLIGSLTSGPSFDVDADLYQGDANCIAACGF
jgi:hypothetical protein